MGKIEEDNFRQEEWNSAMVELGVIYCEIPFHSSHIVACFRFQKGADKQAWDKLIRLEGCEKIVE